MDVRPCPVCGSDVFGAVVSQDPTGERLLRQFCKECERRAAARERIGTVQVALGFSRLLVYAGLVLGFLALAVHHLGVRSHAGFGWRQITGIHLGFACLALGVATRRSLLAVLGLGLTLVSLGADVLEIGRGLGLGLGWRQRLTLEISLALVVGGLLWRRALAVRALGLRRTAHLPSD
jgi:hypothetical protein